MSFQLFELIKSLTKSEKRYFKVNGADRESVIYSELFDAIDAQEEYNEEVLKEQFKSGGYGQQFSRLKNYLYSQLLRSLRRYHAENYSTLKIRNGLNEVFILFEKLLFAQCASQLKKLKKIALKYDHPQAMCEVIYWQIRVCHMLANYEQLEELYEELNEWREKITDYYNIMELYSTLYPIYNKYYSLDRSMIKDKEKQKVENVVSSPYFNKPELANTYPARIRLAKLQDYYYSFAKTPDQGKKALLYALELYESHPWQISEDPRSYESVLTNLLVNAYAWNDWDSFIAARERMYDLFDSKLLNKSKDSRQKGLVYIFALSLSFLLRQGKFKDALKFIRQSNISDYLAYAPYANQMAMIYNISYTYYSNEKYSEALHWINNLINDYRERGREDIYIQSRIFNLMIHYELNHPDFLEYEIKDVRKLLKKTKQQEVMALTVKYLGEYFKQPSKEVLRSFFDELTLLVRKGRGSIAQDAYRSTTWVYGKLHNMSFSEAFHQRPSFEELKRSS